MRVEGGMMNTNHTVPRTDTETAAVINTALKMPPKEAAAYLEGHGVPLYLARRVLSTQNRRPA